MSSSLLLEWPSNSPSYTPLMLADDFQRNYFPEVSLVASSEFWKSVSKIKLKWFLLIYPIDLQG